jgi:hypothetical protein
MHFKRAWVVNCLDMGRLRKGRYGCCFLRSAHRFFIISTGVFDLRRSFHRAAASCLEPPVEQTHVSASPIEPSGRHRFALVRLRSCVAVPFRDHDGDHQLIDLRERQLRCQFESRSMRSSERILAIVMAAES